MAGGAGRAGDSTRGEKKAPLADTLGPTVTQKVTCDQKNTTTETRNFFFSFQKKQIRPPKLRDSSFSSAIFDDFVAFRGQIRTADASKTPIHVAMSARLQLHSYYGNTRWLAPKRQWLMLKFDGKLLCFWCHFR